MRRAGTVAATILVLNSCASGLNLRQQQVYDRFEQCRGAAPGVQLTRVREDGHFTITGTPGGPMEAVQRCMAEKFGTHWVSERRDLQQQATTKGVAPPPASSRFATAADATSSPARLTLGSEWAYRWESPQGKGTFVYVLDREETLDGAVWYVIKGPTTELYYRKDDLALSHDVVNSETTVRRSPPMQFYKWPLTVGQEWEQTYTIERPKDRQSDEIIATCKTEREEMVTVPAGSFQTFKSVCQNKRTGKMIFELWYSPQIGSFVRDVTSLREGGTRHRELIQYRLR